MANMDPVQYLEDEAHRWEVLRSYFLRYGTIGPQVSSFEHFCDVLMPPDHPRAVHHLRRVSAEETVRHLLLLGIVLRTVEGITINRPGVRGRARQRAS